MPNLSHLPTDEQVARAEGAPSMLDSHSGFSTEALRELSMDTSWLDDEIGSVDELGWFGRMGRYILHADSQGFYDSFDHGSVQRAKQVWADNVEASYVGYDNT